MDYSAQRKTQSGLRTVQRMAWPSGLLLQTGKYLLRRANVWDIPSVIEIGRTCFPGQFDADMRYIDEALETVPEAFVVAEVRGQAVGFVFCLLDKRTAAEGVPELEWLGAWDGEITDLAVLPQFRGLGIGRRLMEQAMIALGKRNLLTCKLETYADNNTAVRLYESMGFQIVQTIPKFYPNGKDAKIMVKEMAEKGQNERSRAVRGETK